MSSKSTVVPALPAKGEIKAEVEATKKASMSGLRSLVAGGVGGVCAVLSGMFLFPIFYSRRGGWEKEAYGANGDFRTSI